MSESAAAVAVEPTEGTRAWRRPARIGRGLLVALAMGLAAWGAYRWSEARGLDALRLEANHKLDLFASAVQGVVRRLEHVPATVQLNPDVLTMLRAPGRPAGVRQVNDYLRRLSGHVGSRRVFVLDERGTVLASSDAGSRASLVGRDLSFRPYFLEALAGRVGRHFAIGVQGGQPGYFVSYPIHDGARVVGVATIEIALDGIDDTWPMLGTPALVADGLGVVILSSQDAWRYTTLVPLSPEQQVDVELSRLYGPHELHPFPLDLPASVLDEGLVPEMPVRPEWVRAGAGRGTRTLALGRVIDGMDWRVILFASLQDVRAQAITQATLAALATGFLGLLLVLMQQRRRIVRQKLESRRLLEQANSELERRVARRTAALSQTNDRLRQEVAERQQAEATLRSAQDELIHAAKMAVLGQLATGITHELAQPLAGLRTLSGNAREFLRRGEQAPVEANLELMGRLVDQMGEIIHPLKGYARKSAPHAQAVDLAGAVRNALFLFDPRMRKEAVRLDDEGLVAGVLGWCDANRLQQVLVNLVGNALDAMSGRPEACLRLRVGQGGSTADGDPLAGWVWISVEDNGPGISPEQQRRMFEPFFTTKDVGSGLGLGLAISRDIVREFGGEIEAGNRPEGGACLRVCIPPAGADHGPAS